MDGLLHDSSFSNTVWNAWAVQMVRKAATEVGTIPGLGAVCDGYAVGEQKLGQRSEGVGQYLWEDQKESMADL